jgi:WD40 repeat protein
MSILNLSFNQEASHLACCTEQGDVIYSLNSALQKQFNNKRDGGVGLVELYGKSNIYFLTGGGANPFSSRDSIIMYDEKKKKNIYQIDMNDTVKNIKIAGSKLLVVLEKNLTVFDFKLENGISVNGTKVTYANPYGICAINKNNDDVLVIASLGSKKGEVAIWKPETSVYHLIEAHKNNIEAIAINNDGTLMATASETGTLIKVFSTESFKLQFEFRRGSTTAKVHNLAFNNDSSILACGSFV